MHRCVGTNKKGGMLKISEKGLWSLAKTSKALGIVPAQHQKYNCLMLSTRQQDTIGSSCTVDSSQPGFRPQSATDHGHIFKLMDSHFSASTPGSHDCVFREKYTHGGPIWDSRNHFQYLSFSVVYNILPMTPPPSVLSQRAGNIPPI